MLRARALQPQAARFCAPGRPSGDAAMLKRAMPGGCVDGNNPAPPILNTGAHGTSDERGSEESEQRGDKIAEHDRRTHHCQTGG